MHDVSHLSRKCDSNTHMYKYTMMCQSNTTNLYYVFIVYNKNIKDVNKT